MTHDCMTFRGTWQSVVCLLPFARIIAIHVTIRVMVPFTILIVQIASRKFPLSLVQSLGTLMSHTPLHQDFRDRHRTVECLLVILSDDNAAVAVERSTALRSRIHPRESSTLPKDTDVSTIDIFRRHLLFGQFPQDAFQFFD
jgi:hypothetical protein